MMVLLVDTTADLRFVSPLTRTPGHYRSRPVSQSVQIYSNGGKQTQRQGITRLVTT